MEINKEMITLIIGVSGATIVLVAFLMNQLNKWTNDNIKYDFLNFLGSLLLVIYALLLGSVPFLVLNTIWGGFSLIDVIKKLV
ncbi:MAG: hypothetical protein Q9M91_02260 [Candidatus Dojkabacteria bacterium]|nr:hypothetical protein [Candidatus Dojkabacteria bacterium]MDQ7020648.1 hypothetical protein [Candidatus Dojkabacteria bacterium]